MKTSQKHFALCINNSDYEASLIQGKLYRILPDEDASKDDFIRVIDESGEDYLYHESMFMLVELPPEVRRALRAIT
jgi:hypothetical protein